jgi:hypothetical protein
VQSIAVANARRVQQQRVEQIQVRSSSLPHCNTGIWYYE